MRIHAWLRKYLEYPKRFGPHASVVTTKAEMLRLVIGRREGRGSEMGAPIPLWADGKSKQAIGRLIRGKSELLSGMGITKKLDLAANFGRNQSKVGQSEWAMMTFSEKHRLVFPLSPTSCAYAKLNVYFGKLRSSEIEVPQLQGEFGRNVPVR